MTEILKQGNGAPLAFEMQAAVIFAAINGYFDSFPPEGASKAEKSLQDYLLREGGDVLKAIREKKEIGEETEKTLRGVLEKFVERSAK
jgi:F-type H+-transporting ATPase subunit alpha